MFFFLNSLLLFVLSVFKVQFNFFNFFLYSYFLTWLFLNFFFTIHSILLCLIILFILELVTCEFSLLMLVKIANDFIHWFDLIFKNPSNCARLLTLKWCVAILGMSSVILQKRIWFAIDEVLLASIIKNPFFHFFFSLAKNLNPTLIIVLSFSYFVFFS